MHEECLKSPFLVAWLTLGGALLLVILQLGISVYVHFRSRSLEMKSNPGRAIVLTQKWLFVLISGLYPLIAKRCFSLLHCSDCDSKEQCDSGSAMLIRGPTVVRRTWDAVNGDLTRVDLKMPCWQAY